MDGAIWKLGIALVIAHLPLIGVAAFAVRQARLKPGRRGHIHQPRL